MDNIVITAANQVTEADLRTARPGGRFNRLDLTSQLVLVAVESLGREFDDLERDRIGVCLAARTASLSTDIEYWKERALVGGPSPTLFAYTLPSAAIGEIAIRYQLRGPNLCFVGDSTAVLPEAVDLIGRGEADACVCIYCNIVTADAAELLQNVPVARVSALFLRRGRVGIEGVEEIGGDMECLCAKLCARESVA